MSQSTAHLVTQCNQVDAFTYGWAKAETPGHLWDEAGHLWDTYEWAKAETPGHLWDEAGHLWDTYEWAA